MSATKLTSKKEAMLVNNILYLLEIIHHLYQQNCWLISFICRYIPFKQWAYDDSRSPKYQKLKIDALPLILNVEPWDYKDLMAYYAWRYKDDYKPIKPVKRRSECDIDDDCKCLFAMLRKSICIRTTAPKARSCVKSVRPGFLRLIIDIHLLNCAVLTVCMLSHPRRIANTSSSINA